MVAFRLLLNNAPIKITYAQHMCYTFIYSFLFFFFFFLFCLIQYNAYNGDGCNSINICTHGKCAPFSQWNWCVSKFSVFSYLKCGVKHNCQWFFLLSISHPHEYPDVTVVFFILFFFGLSLSLVLFLLFLTFSVGNKRVSNGTEMNEFERNFCPYFWLHFRFFSISFSHCFCTRKTGWQSWIVNLL